MFVLHHPFSRVTRLLVLLFLLTVSVAGVPCVSVAQPGPQIQGYDWGKQWIVSANTCTKNTSDEYATDITVANDGTSSFTVDTVEIIQDFNGVFSLDYSDVATSVIKGLQIRPGDDNRRYQRVIFRPKDEKFYTAKIRLTTTEGKVVESILQGIGTESHVGMSNHDFGTVRFEEPGATAAEGFVTLTTKPTRPTTITGVTLSGTEAGEFQFDWSRAAAPYDYAPTAASPWQSIPPNTTIQIPVNFTPASAGDEAKVAVVEVTGDFSSCDTAMAVVTGIASINLSVDDAAAGEFTLSTDRSGAIVVSLPSSMEITLDLHDATGRHLARLADGQMEAGAHRIAIEHLGLVSGVYLYRAQAGGVIRTGRIVVVR